jgi:hypothetical protein
VQNDFSNTICQQEPIKTIIFSQGGKASAPSGLSACAVVAGFGYGQIEDPGWNLLRLEGLGRIEMVRFLMVVQFLQPVCPGALPYPQGPERGHIH